MVTLRDLVSCPKLKQHKGALVNTVELLTQWQNTSEAIGLYLSASWCGPCRNFTPKLAETFNKVNKVDATTSQESNPKLKFPIIFVSCDRATEDYSSYFSSMPALWYAVPFEERYTRRLPMESLKIQQIPTLLIFDSKTGVLITQNGVAAIKADPSGSQFPYRDFTLPVLQHPWIMLLLKKLPFIVLIIVMMLYQQYKARQAQLKA